MPDKSEDLKKENQRLRRENARLHRIANEYRALISQAEHIGWCIGRNPGDDFEDKLRSEMWKRIQRLDEESDAMKKDPDSCVLLLRSEYRQFTGRLAQMDVQALFTAVEDKEPITNG